MLWSYLLLRKLQQNEKQIKKIFIYFTDFNFISEYDLYNFKFSGNYEAKFF